MGGWRAGAALIFNHIARTSKPVLTLYPSLKLLNLYPPSTPSLRLFTLRSFSAIASQLSVYSNESDSGSRDLCHNYGFGAQEDEEMGKIPVKAYFLCTRFADGNDTLGNYLMNFEFLICVGWSPLLFL